MQSNNMIYQSMSSDKDQGNIPGYMFGARQPAGQENVPHQNLNLGEHATASFNPDPYAPSLVNDLLTGGSNISGGNNEWREIPDIVKLTFKAICDVVRSQGLAIREVERALPSKCTKSELNAGLTLKANASDVSRTIAELAT